MCEVLNTSGFWCRRPHINANQILWDSAQQKQLEPQVLPVNVIASSFYVASLYFNPSNTHNVIVDIRGELIQALPKRKHFFVGCFLRERKRKVGEWQRGALQDSDTALERDTCERGHGCLRALTRVVLHLWGNMWWRLQPIMKCNTIVGFICWKKAPLCDGKSFSPA